MLESTAQRLSRGILLSQSTMTCPPFPTLLESSRRSRKWASLRWREGRRSGQLCGTLSLIQPQKRVYSAAKTSNTSDTSDTLDTLDTLDTINTSYCIIEDESMSTSQQQPTDCFICRKHRGEIVIPGGAIHEDELLYT